jgi:hypothetical protein
VSAIRALATDLAARSDAELRDLLVARPDLAHPAVPDFAALAARAATRASVQRALDNLTEPQLRVLEAAVLVTDQQGSRDTGTARVRCELPGLAGDAVERIIGELAALALLHASAAGNTDAETHDDGALLPLPAVRESLGPYPAGLGRPFAVLARSVPGYRAQLPGAVDRVRALPGGESDSGESDGGVPWAGAEDPDAAAAYLEALACSPGRWQQLMEHAPERTAELLGRFSAAPVGAAPAQPSEPDALSPLGWLLEHGLLARIDASHVELPRAAGRAARGHACVPTVNLEPPAASLPVVRASLRDNAAYSAVAETLRLVSELAAVVQEGPVATLRAGGVGVRELRRVADALRTAPDEAAWLLELGAMSGVLVLDVDTSRWSVPVESGWGFLPRAKQWRVLAGAWLAAGRAPSLVGGKTTAGVSINALAAEASRPDAPAVRCRVLAALQALAGGAGPEASAVEAGAVISWLTWHHPRLHRRFRSLVPGMLTEAAHLGLTGSWAPTQLGALLAAEEYDDAEQVLASELPAPLSHFMLQADLTAIAPGYLEPSVSSMLQRLAIREGRGPATIYRFSPESIRRALDAGMDAAMILAFLSAHAATEVPQPLRYLVEDTAARHGRLRVGAAASYVRSDDVESLDALVSDPRAAALGLTRIAATVVAARTGPRELAAALKEMGHAAAPEPAVHAADDSRTPPGAPGGPADAGGPPPSSSYGAEVRDRPVLVNAWKLSEAEIAAQLRALRSGSGGPRAGAGSLSAESETLLGLETLRQAIRLRRAVSLEVADARGNQSRQVVLPLAVTAGRVRAVDQQTQVELVVSLHRVMDVEIVEGAASDA